MKQKSLLLMSSKNGAIYICPYLVVLLVAIPLSPSDVNVENALFSIEMNGHFSAEHGMFFATPNTIHLYSRLPKVRNVEGRFQLVPVDDELRSQWEGEPYYHEVYELRKGTWLRTLREFSEGPELYLDFAPCDPFNQLDVSRRESQIASLLGNSAKIKDVSRFVSESRGSLVGPTASDHATVIYSDTPTRTVTYSLKLGLLAADSREWHLLRTLTVGVDGYFCGTRSWPIELPAEATGRIVLVYVNEPAGSSNSIAIYSYLLRKQIRK